MNILILYGTTEGQTRKICKFAAERLEAAGHCVALYPAEGHEDVDPAAFDAAILAASVHLQRYQKPLVQFASRHAVALNAMKTLFISVSLSAAGDDQEDWKGLNALIKSFGEETGWTPGRVEQVAGAFRFTAYDFLKYWAMRWIEAKKDKPAKPGQDKEYTDWAALEAVLDDWAA